MLPNNGNIKESNVFMK